LSRRPVSDLLLIGSLTLTVLATSTAATASGLTRLERLGYARWVSAWQAAPDSLPQRPLYPLGLTPSECVATLEVPRRVVAAVAVRQLEDALSRAWDPAPLQAFGPALKTARDYRTLGRYDRALEWYRLALAGAPLADRPALKNEMFAVALVSGDSLQIVNQLLSLVGSSDLRGLEPGLILAYRHLLVTRDAVNLHLLQDKVARRLPDLGPEVAIWHARSLVSEHRYDEALPVLLSLLRRPVPADLEPRLLAWVVRSVPDLLLVTGQEAQADVLYAGLAGLGDRDISRWAVYQMAWLELRRGRYDEAGTLVARLATAQEEPWHDRALVLAEWAQRLAACEREGKRYGTDRIHRR